MYINVKKAQHKINEINALLAQKCDGKLYLDLDLYDNIIKRYSEIALYPNTNTEIILCLNYKSSITRSSTYCVSSIACKINKHNGEMEISSQTEGAYEGKKYNLLLRAVCFSVASDILYKKTGSLSRKRSSLKSRTTRSVSHWYPVKSIVSRAINPISTYSLVKYFNAHNPDLDTYLDENGFQDRSTITLDVIEDYEVPITLDMSEEEATEYMKNNEDFGQPLHLVIRLRNKTTIKKINETLMSTLDRIGCP